MKIKDRWTCPLFLCLDEGEEQKGGRKRREKGAALRLLIARQGGASWEGCDVLPDSFVRPDRNSYPCANCKKLASTAFQSADNGALVTSGGLALNLKKMKKCRDSG